MSRIHAILAGCLSLALLVAPARGDDEPKPAEAAAAEGSVSFLKDVAPILVQSCTGCHNPKKTEGKYDMTSFEKFVEGGEIGQGFNIVPGKPEESYLIELVGPLGSPRMPYKQDPLTDEKIAVLTKWVTEGAKYDGSSPTEDWVGLITKSKAVVIPESYPVPMPITALGFSPDGTEIAASGYHEVTLWTTSDGTLARRVQGLDERTYDIAYSPDGKWLATASGNPGQHGSVKLWLAEPAGGGKPVRDLVDSEDSQFAVAFSPDSTLLATAGADRAIRIFKVETGEQVALIEDHADWIFDVAFSPDGKRLASASRDKTSKVFDVEKKEALVTFPGHAETVYTVAFAPDGKLVASGGGDNQVRFWNPDDEAKQVRNLGGFGGAVFQVLYGPDGKTLTACGADKTVRVFDPTNGKGLHTLQGHDDWVYAIALSPDGKTIASGSWDGQVKLWTLADGKPGATFLAAPGLKSSTIPAQAAAR